jgi:hypothetical protein
MLGADPATLRAQATSARHREVRDLARKRMQLVRSRTSHILAVENTTARQSGTRITSNQVNNWTRPLSISCICRTT